MTTLEYIEIPPGATRLRGLKKDSTNEIQPAPKILTSVPQPSPPPSPSSFKRRSSLLTTAADSIASPTLSLIPQLLLSSTLPSTPHADGSHPPATNPRRNDEPVLLSSKDPLSLPIMSVNFKRFVSIIGPVFWLQDRIEEILFWKRGWLRTSVWMAAYAFICFYPRLLLLLPHIALIAIILSTYPYPDQPFADPVGIYDDGQATTAPPTEGSVPWQANITGIQNLMGAVADAHDLVQPYIYHLQLTPAQITTPRPQQERSNSASSIRQSPPRHSPYTPHILQLLVLTFFPLLFIVNLPYFPIRAVCIIAGLAPFVATHPTVQRALPVLVHAAQRAAPIIVPRLRNYVQRAATLLRRPTTADLSTKLNKTDVAGVPPLSMIVQRILDDDHLSDECWNAETREVQLWENERFGGPLPTDLPSLMAASHSVNAGPPPLRGWSKQNLRPGERAGWTRGQDGWNGGPGGSGNLIEGSGQVSSNLTFSLAPGWVFVETEDWRKDVHAVWSGCGADAEGWVYTNDIWLGPRPMPYTSGGGSVTRRRRWIRRVWYDPKRACKDS